MNNNEARNSKAYARPVSINGTDATYQQRDTVVELKDPAVEFDEEEDPEEKKPPRMWIPFFIIGLSLIQIAVQVAMIVDNDGFEPWAENPMLGPSEATLLKFGAKRAAEIRQGEIWRLVAPIVLHSGILQLIISLVFQGSFCWRLERFWGFFRVGPIFILSGIAGNLLSALFLPEEVSIGASSAIAGLLGSLLSDCIINWKILPTPWKTLVTILIQIIVFIAIGLIPVIDNFAHVGGLLVGFFTSLILLPKVHKERVHLTRVFRIVGLIGDFVYFTLFLGMFFGMFDT